jgi:hypothetical protein
VSHTPHADVGNCTQDSHTCTQTHEEAIQLPREQEKTAGQKRGGKEGKSSGGRGTTHANEIRKAAGWGEDCERQLAREEGWAAADGEERCVLNPPGAGATVRHWRLQERAVTEEENAHWRCQCQWNRGSEPRKTDACATEECGGGGGGVRKEKIQWTARASSPKRRGHRQPDDSKTAQTPGLGTAGSARH